MEQNPKVCLTETCESSASLISQFLVAAAEIHGRTLTPRIAEAYEHALQDLPVVELRDALNATIRDIQFWPTPAHVRQQWESLHAKHDQAAAEQAWDIVLEQVRKWGVDQSPVFHNGEFQHAPGFDDVTEFAMRQVGGYRTIGNAPEDQLRFVRRDFLAAYGRYRETGGYLAPSRAESRQLLERLASGAGLDLDEIGKCQSVMKGVGATGANN